ncbi:MAG: ABC transporter permease subunit [Alphaproteobacteria bacterium]|nr:MAG: ABC transporter permease subunit [Alphaproteobacteria bacterium]
MTVTTDPPKESFRLGMLIYDTRYRAMTIQVVAMFGFMLLLGWLVSNTIRNLDALGKGIDFGFLWEPAGYDINQHLIEYNSQMPHIRAAAIGLMNTLLVAFMGCVLATILGVVIGVLRLSRNWLVAKLMTVYVEGFRNVPVLLWIVFFMAILIETLPAPRDFRSGEATMFLGDMVAFTNRGFYIPEPKFTAGLGDVSVFNGAFAVSLDLIAFLLTLGAGILIARLVKLRADRIQEATGDRPTTWYLELGFVFLPAIVLLWVLGFYLEPPALKGFNFKGGIHMRNSLIALWLALSFYTAAFIAEIVRGGILAVPKGQTEASYALGLRPNLTMRLVILPQALRVIIPPLISNYLNLTKNSSLAIAVGYMDITGTLGGITLNQTGRELECILLLMLCYLTISLLISAVMNWYNSHVKLVER